MKRIVTGALAPLMVTGFLLGDVVSLPQAGPVDPAIERLAISASQWRPFSSAQASLVALAGAPAEQQLLQEQGPELVTPEFETADFTVAGVSWDSEQATPEDIKVRVREAGVWSDWQALEPNDEGPDAGTEEYERASAVTGTDPIVTDGADAIQVSVDAAPDGANPELQLTVIDPGTSPADGVVVESTPLSSASAASSRPAIVSRAAWGAKESLRSCTPSVASTLKAATIHHTAGSNNYTASQAAGVVRGIYAYHTQSLGWCDIGYNFLVDKFGTVYEGRYGGVDRPVRGAHAGGFNNETFGVSAMGNYETAAAPPAMVASITRVIAWKLGLYRLNPNGTTRLTSAGGTSKYSTGREVQLPVVFAHRDIGQTSCPGRNIYSQMAAIRNEAANLTDNGSYVVALYADMLGRVPGDSEINFWVPITRANRWKTADGFTNSEEYRRKFITAAYRDVLARTPDNTGLAFWLDRLAKRQVSLDEIRPTFMDSAEFYSRGGGTEAGLVRELFRRALGREASSADVDFWNFQLRQKGRDFVITAVYGSAESARVRVDRAYRAWLGRSAASGERAYWESTVLLKGDEQLRMSVMVSEEYFQRARHR